jgi:tetratricopeptide (TPR) repeat protein
MKNLWRTGLLVRWLMGVAVAGLLAACTGAPQRDAGPAAAVSAAASAPAAVPAPSTPASPEPPPAAAAMVQSTVLSTQDIQRSLSAALDALQAGQEEQAELELRRVLQSEPNQRLALSLMRQIKEDPVALLGRESFAYRVQTGETLSRIAQRFMNDLHLFYALARYNNIKVPRALSGGQMIRVPGKAPPAGSLTPPTSAPAQATSPPVPATADPRTSTVSPEAAAEAAAARAAKQKAETVARQTRLARTAFAKQDLDAALRAWDAVLELEPDNRTALLERQKVVGLKEKLGKVK